MRPGILIVDDDALLRFFFRAFLKKNAVEVFEAGNGMEALSLLEKTAIHLIITDFHMPVMNGLELLKRIRANPGTRFLPVIMITANAEEEVREEAIRLGANHFISKPVTAEDFLHHVRKTLEFVEE